MSQKREPVRILHVLGSLNRGGVETWLVHILRNIDRARFHFDFLVHDSAIGAYDDQVLALGSRVIPCLSPKRPRQYSRNFNAVMKEYGPYDVLHSHVAHFSGYGLKLAYKANVPLRIAHSHNDTLLDEENANPVRKLYVKLMKSWISKYGTLGLAASDRAAISLFGPNWQDSNRFPVQVLYYGLDFSVFRGTRPLTDLRAELRIPKDAYVVGHVGRFVKQKNHEFILQIAASMIAQDSRVYLLLVGDGILRLKIQQKAQELGILDNVIFAGVRDDVPVLMKHVMDFFLLPSLHEGLGIVAVEAQAAGLDCLFSNTIPKEADIVLHLVSRLSLETPASVWADEILGIRSRQQSNSDCKRKALNRVENSIFSINKCMEQLEDVYSS